MGNITRIGAITLLSSLVAAQFGASQVGVIGGLLGLAILAVGLVLDWRARQSAPPGPVRNWAEDFTAQVRRERAAAEAARQAAGAVG
jgi:hypothetical protein